MGIDGDRDIRSAEPPERPRTTEQAVVIVAAAPSIVTLPCTPQAPTPTPLPPLSSMLPRPPTVVTATALVYPIGGAAGTTDDDGAGKVVVVVAAAPSIATPSLLLLLSSSVVSALTSQGQPSLSPTPFPPPPAETAVLLRADAAPPTFPPSRVSVSWRGESIEGEGGASAGLILMAGIHRPLIFYCQFFQWRSIGFSPQQICKQNQSIANYHHDRACAMMSTTP